MNDDEPQIVQHARLVLQAWELRDGHRTYVNPLGGGSLGYRAECWDCEWRGTEFLRGDEILGSEESRAHKRNAQRQASEHRHRTRAVFDANSFIRVGVLA
jgi:hypothetical protein